MVGMLNPRYQLPHRDHFNRNAIPALYAEVHDQVHEDLQKEIKFHSATTDMWSSCTMILILVSPFTTLAVLANSFHIVYKFISCQSSILEKT